MPPRKTAEKPKHPVAARSVPARARGTAASTPAVSPPADLVQLAGRIPAELLEQLAAAIESRHWLFAVWNVSGGKIHLQRTATEFPTADLDQAVALLSENLQPLKASK